MVFSWNINLPSFPGISSSSVGQLDSEHSLLQGRDGQWMFLRIECKKLMIVCGEGDGSNQRFGRCRMVQVLRSDDTACSPGWVKEE